MKTPPSKAKTRKNLSKSRKSGKRRGEIIRVAIEIINRKSYAQATMVDIAAELDLRDATLYHYFYDKRTLAYACHRASLERAQHLLETADQEEKSGIEKLRSFIRGMLLESSRNGPLLYLGDISYLDAAQRKVIQTWTDRLRDLLVRFLEEGMADGTILECESELVVQLLLGMLIWLGRWASSIPHITVDRLMSAIESFSFAGMEKPQPIRAAKLRRHAATAKDAHSIRTASARKSRVATSRIAKN